MSSIDDLPRTGHGLRELRKRYQRRARSLATSEDYLGTIRTVRSGWNESYARYPIPARTLAEDGAPQALVSDAQFAQQRRQAALTTGEIDLEALQTTPAEAALRNWRITVTAVARIFWPYPDFPQVGPNGEHPAMPFVAMSLHREPESLLDSLDELFPEFALSLVPMPGAFEAFARGEQSITNLFSSVQLCIPIYPGVSADDLRRAAPDIAEQAARLYGYQTTNTRIAQLAMEGLSRRAIAERLGISTARVGQVLKTISHIVESGS